MNLKNEKDKASYYIELANENLYSGKCINKE